jgi:hypothetical protein
MNRLAFALLVMLASSSLAQKRMPRCGAPGVPADREDCVRARVDSTTHSLAITVGRALETLPDTERVPFLKAERAWADWMYATCRKRAAGPMPITPATPEYAGCVVAFTGVREGLLKREISDRGSRASGTPCLGYEPDTVTLTGKVERRTFPGLPNFESVAKGDEAETGFYLLVPAGVCVSRNIDEVDVPSAGVTLVQLLVSEDAWDWLRARLGREVTVKGTLFHAFSGHHHADLLLNMHMK